MFQILEAATLVRLLDAAPEAVHDTIETGGWTGCLWPGHPEWEIHEACVQIRSLALHYFTVRYPAAEAHRHEIAAQLLASQVCPQGGDTHLAVEPLVDQALLWLWALAGGPVAPNARGDGVPPPPDTAGRMRLPGGDPVAFTHRALRLVAALTQQDTQEGMEAGVICADCGAPDLELWYSGQTWGDTLCESCYEARVAHGQARPHEL